MKVKLTLINIIKLTLINIIGIYPVKYLSFAKVLKWVYEHREGWEPPPPRRLHVGTCLATRWLRPTSFLRYADTPAMD